MTGGGEMADWRVKSVSGGGHSLRGETLEPGLSGVGFDDPKHDAAVLAALHEAAPVGILLVDPAGRILSWNRRFAEIWRLPEDLIRKRDDARLLSLAVSQLARPKEFLDRVEYLYAHPGEKSHDTVEFLDGRIIERYSGPVHQLGGPELGRVWIFRDATDQVRAEKRLQAHLAATRAVAEAADVGQAFDRLAGAVGGILGWDWGAWWRSTGDTLRCDRIWKAPGRDFAHFEAATRRLTLGPSQGGPGMVRDSSRPLWVEDLAHEARHGRAAVASADGLLSGVFVPVRCQQRFWGVLEFLSSNRLKADPETEEFLVSVGTLLGQFLNRRDAEEQKLQTALQNERLRQEQITTLQGVDRLKRAFLSTIGHEFRTPLSLVVANAEFLEDEIGGPLTSRQRTFLAEIQAGALGLERLVNDLLEFAALESSVLTLDLQEADLRTVVQGVLDGLGRQAAAAGVALRFGWPAAPVACVMDRGRIARALQSLVSNGIKFTPPGGKVRVAIYQSRLKIRVVVRDSGIGIEPAALPLIFDRFFQVNSTNTRAHGGSGLGLCIAKALVAAHGGTVGVRSKPGEGSTFWFNLPRDAHVGAVTFMPQTSDTTSI